MNNELAKLKELAQRATPWPWKWFTSNSHNRLSSVPNGKDGDVISAFKAVDGVACVSVSHANMAFIEAAHPGAVIALIERLEAVEAQVKELTADLDKESEIRHRIHEELNAIKGEQKPIGAFHISGGEVEATSDYIEPGGWPVNDGIVEVYAHPAPERLPPEITPENAHLIEKLQGVELTSMQRCIASDAYSQAIADTKALGAKPLPVIELTDSTLAEVVRAWNRADYPADAYPAMREVLRAAGLEVKP